MSYGQNAPFGLRPVSSISGGSWTEKTNEYYIHASADGATTYATSIFNGDPVIWNPAVATTISGVATIARYPIDNATIANEATPVLGVFQSCKYIDVTGKLIQAPYWPASHAVQPGTKIKANIIDDPDAVFEIQVSTSTNVANDARFGGTTDVSATLSYFGQNFGFGLAGGGNNLLPNNPTAGNIRTGASAIYLNNVGTTATNRVLATLPLKAIGYSQNVENIIYEHDAPTTARQFLNVRVMINNHVYRAGTVGITPA